MRPPPPLAALFLAATFGACAASARADLGHDVATLRAAWDREGDAVRLAPRLLERDTPWALALPVAALRTRGGCTTVALLGAPTASFTLRFADGSPRSSAPPLRSVAGVIELTRCGRAKRELRDLIVEARSPRIVVETLVLTTLAPPGEVLSVLPERLPGPAAANIDVGRATPSSAIVAHAKAHVTRLESRGAQAVDHGLLASELDGSGMVGIELEAGCHELVVLGFPAPADAPRDVDIDFELLWPSGETAAVDRADAADAAVHLCVGRRQKLAARFTGALPGTPVVFVHGQWPLPAGLPASAPPAVQAGLAQVLRERELKIGGRGPVHTSLGVGGVTGIPVELAPDACYVLAVTVGQGVAKGIGAAVVAGHHRYQDNGGQDGQATALAFCARGADAGLIEIEAGGSGLLWTSALWEIGRAAPGALAE